MKRLLIITLLVLVILTGCVKQADEKLDVDTGASAAGEETTPLDVSLEDSETVTEELNLEELDALDEDLSTLEGDLANL